MYFFRKWPKGEGRVIAPDVAVLRTVCIFSDAPNVWENAPFVVALAPSVVAIAPDVFLSGPTLY